MMVLFYNLGIFFYSLAIKFSSLFNAKAALFVNGRKGWEKQLKGKIIAGEKYHWFHCASLGEFEQCRPVIEEVKSKLPECKVLLTFFSPSGFEIRKNYTEADVICYLPIDTKKNARRFLDITKPEKALFVKYEFWYHYINELKNRNIPLYAISAIFREKQQFFQSSLWGKWFRKMLFSFQHFFVQNEKSAKLLKQIGLSNYTIAGDTRFDRVVKIAESSKEIPIVEKFKNNQPLIVIGSSWKMDEEILIPYINRSVNIKFIIAPHEVTESNINRIINNLEKSTIRFSNVGENTIYEHQVLIIDSIGLLSSIYKYADMAYIGGGFGVGIHNILEAATYGMPVVFGPNYKKFDEACNLIKAGGAFSVNTYPELEAVFIKYINNPDELKKTSKISLGFVKNNQGATSFIIKKVFNI